MNKAYFKLLAIAIVIGGPALANAVSKMLPSVHGRLMAARADPPPAGRTYAQAQPIAPLAGLPPPQPDPSTLPPQSQPPIPTDGPVASAAPTLDPTAEAIAPVSAVMPTQPIDSYAPPPPPAQTAQSMIAGEAPPPPRRPMSVAK